MPGHTEDISAAGVRLMSGVCLAPGTPLMLRCCFGGAAQLHVVGQVIYCRPNTTATGYMAGVKFAALKEWESTLLNSAVAELMANVESLGQSFLSIHISKDSLASNRCALRSLRGTTRHPRHARTALHDSKRKPHLLRSTVTRHYHFLAPSSRLFGIRNVSGTAA